VVNELVVDGLSPQRVEHPTSPERLAELLREADRAGEAVLPIGAGRAIGLGDPPRRIDVAIGTRGLDRIVEASPADLTLTVEAGVTLGEIADALRPLGQHLPIDPPGGPGHTVGGVLAAGLFGPLRQRYGAPRDFLIGLRVALPDGRLAASGGRVVKNVSGYDMGKLHLGALGSLGVIVTASFKVFPRPHEEVTLEHRTGEAWDAAARVLAMPGPPAAVELDSGGRVLVRLGGTRTGVARQARELGWQEVDSSVWSLPRATGPALARVSVPARALRGVLRSLPASASWWAWPGLGVAHWGGDLDAERLGMARARAEREGGSLVLLRAPLELKRQVGAWGAPPSTLAWMRRLRDAFDPRRTISPGRYLVE
jgi:glycolate oxidase FAD binding subunit